MAQLLLTWMFYGVAGIVGITIFCLLFAPILLTIYSYIRRDKMAGNGCLILSVLIYTPVVIAMFAF